MPISIAKPLRSRFITCSLITWVLCLGAVQATQPTISYEPFSNAIYALDDTGQLWKWGFVRNDVTPDSGDRSEPGPVLHGNDFISIGKNSGNIRFATKADGTIWQWGDGIEVPTLVKNDFVSFAHMQNSHTLALKADGSLWAWGNNQFGQLGDGTTIDRSVPVKIGSDFKRVTTSYATSIAIKNDGSLWYWGTEYDSTKNKNGPWTDGNNYNCLWNIACPKITTSTPTLIGNNFVEATAGMQTVALKEDGSLWFWGRAYPGLVDNSPVDNQNIVDITMADSPLKLGDDYQDYYTNGYIIATLKKNGSLSVKGSDLLAHAGDLSSNFNKIVLADNKIDSIEINAIKQDGTLWRFQPRAGWKQIGSNYSDLSSNGRSTLALKRDGTLWSWGYDELGQLGNGITITTKIIQKPIQIGTGYTALAGAIALKEDGNLWNAESNLPLLPVTYGRTVPPFIAISGNRRQGFAIGSDRSLWAWGYFWMGLADYRTTFAIDYGDQPKQIDVDVASISSVGDTYTWVKIIKSDGTLWTWGYEGEADPHAIYSTLPYFSNYSLHDDKPTLVNHGYISASADIALRFDGSLWSIEHGQRKRFNPVTGTQFPFIDGLIETRLGDGYRSFSTTGGFVNRGNYTLALKQDDSVWSWGDNDSGQLGDGTYIKRDASNPALVASDFVAVFTNGCTSHAIRADGQLFAWGCNDSGQFGDGTTISQNYPLDIGFYIGTQGFMRGNLPLPAATPRAAPADLANSFSQLPIFAPSYYRLRNLDVDQVFGDNTAALTQHWLQNGLAERREGSILFDSVWYLQRHPDLLKAFGGDTVTAATHFAQSGIKEARESSPAFSLALYKMYNPDLVAAFGDNHAAYFEHFSKAGAGECRTASAFFDARFYLSANPDVAKAFNNDCAQALVHWLDHGRAEGRQASPTAMPIYPR